MDTVNIEARDREGVWERMTYVNMVQVPEIRRGLDILLGGISEFERNWRLAWLTPKAETIWSTRTQSLWASIAVLSFGRTYLSDTTDELNVKEVNVRDQVHIIGTPFGVYNDSLNHSVMGGIISNKIETEGRTALLLSDSKCFPGTEGAPVYQSHALVGVSFFLYSSNLLRCCYPPSGEEIAILSSLHSWHPYNVSSTH